MLPVRLGLGMAAPSCGTQVLLFAILMLNPFKRQIDIIFLWNVKAGSKLLVLPAWERHPALVSLINDTVT